MKIDNDFKNLLPELTKEEYTGLERDIVKHGILSPIIVWNGTIIDGHNRYAIAQAHRFPESAIPTREIKFDGKASAMQWIVNHQFAKRNLEKSERMRLLMKIEAQIAKEKSAKSIANLKQNTEASNLTYREDSGETAEIMAKKMGVSKNTYKDMKTIIEKGTPEQIARMDKGGKGNGVSAIAKEIKGKQSDATKKTSESKPLEPAEDFLIRSRAEAMAAETRTAIGVIGVQAQKITEERLNGFLDVYKKKELEDVTAKISFMIENCKRAIKTCEAYLETCSQ